MSTFTQILYHLVFSTKNRERTLTQDNRHKLFQYTWGIVKKQKCHPYWINGVEDHIHSYRNPCSPHRRIVGSDKRH
jgi:REP element-mobilizing transposase RayT